MVKILKDLLLLNQWTDFYELWYVAQATLAFYILFTLLPCDDLDLFLQQGQILQLRNFIKEETTIMEILAACVLEIG